MIEQTRAGHVDTRPALEGIDLKLFSEEGAGADVGAAGDTVPNSGGTDDGNSDGVGGAADSGGDTDEQAETTAEKQETEAENQVPDKYDLTIPEGFTVDETAMTEFTGVAKELGLNNEQANKLVGMHTKVMQDAFKALNDARTAEVTSWGESAKKELGSTFDATLHDVSLGVQAIEKDIPTLREAMDKTGFGNTIEGIRLMAAVGRLYGEDQGGKDQGGQSAATKPLYSDMQNFKK